MTKESHSTRASRLADALRQNLKKRKAVARARRAVDDLAAGADGDGENDSLKADPRPER
jgi:hypothetical protein